jgi:hypothetical protein
MEEHRFSITAALKDVRRYVAGQYMIPPHKVRQLGSLLECDSVHHTCRY